MTKSINETCSRLSKHEFPATVNSKWTEKTVRFRFIGNSILLKESLMQLQITYPHLEFSNLSEGAKQAVHESLARWQETCGNHIAFKQIKGINLMFKGISFVGCSNYSRSDFKNKLTTKGITLSYFANQHGERNKIPYLSHSVVCIPPAILSNSDRQVVSHEIGHALGIAHPHEVASITTWLKKTPEGLGCSIMNYPYLVKSSLNPCKTTNYCLNETFAVYPGPLDQQICNELYNPGSISFFQPTSFIETITPDPLMFDFLISSTERALSSFLIHSKHTQVNPNTAETISAIFNIITRSCLQNSVVTATNALILLECFARTKERHYGQIISDIRVIVNLSSLIHITINSNRDDDIQQMTSVLLFTISYCLGAVCGKKIGEQFASFSDTVIDCISSGVHQTLAILPSVIRRPVTSFTQFFFNTKKASTSDEAIKKSEAGHDLKTH